MAFGDLFRSRDEILRRMVEEENKKNRDLADPVSGAHLCESLDKLYSRILISGGNQTERLYFFADRIRLALRSRRSVVAIFCPQEPADGFFVPFEETGLCVDHAFPPVCFTDGTVCGFDPLLMDDPEDLPSILTKISACISGENHARSDFWMFVLDLLKAAHGTPTLKNFLELDLHHLQQSIMRMSEDGSLSPMDAADLIQRYDPSLSAQAAFAGDLKTALTPLRKCLRENNVGLDALNRKQGILFLDCLSAGDRAPIDLLLQLTRRAATQSKRLVLALDSVGCSDQEKLRAQFLTDTDASLPLLLGGDLPALLGSLFDKISGSNSLKLVFRHDTGTSAEKWAKALGEYSQQIIESSSGEGRSTAALLDRNNNRNLTIRVDHHAHRIPENAIGQLAPGRAVIRLPEIHTIQRAEFLTMTLTQMKEKLCCFVKSC